MRNCSGFTLIEMLVAMGMFVVVMLVGTRAFQRVVTLSGQQVKSAATNIDGLAGLELLRYDLEHAGFGLPWRFQSYNGPILFRHAVHNTEIEAGANSTALGFDPGQLNAVVTTNIQAIAGGTATKEVNGTSVTHPSGGPDYLVVRSTMASLTGAARKWTYVNAAKDAMERNVSYLRKWNNSDDFATNDRIVTVRSSYSSVGIPDKILLMNGNEFEVPLTPDLALPAGDSFKPADAFEIVVAYGVRNSASSGLRMPYNRTDYYLSRPASGVPSNCNPGTGILYKTVVSHDTGGFEKPHPIIDCVGDLQVDFEYDPNDDGNTSLLPPSMLSAKNAAEIRDLLKTVRVHILAHEGKKDRQYSYPGDSILVGDRRFPASSGRTLGSAQMEGLFGRDWRQYRWKVYTLVIQPKNLNQ